MLTRDDRQLLAQLTKDYETFQKAAAAQDPEMASAWQRRVDLIRDLLERLQAGEHGPEVVGATETVLGDFRLMAQREGIGRQAILLMKRREFAIEMLLRRIQEAAP